MEKDYQKLFHATEKPEVPAGLQDFVLARIDSEARRMSRVRLAMFVPLVFISSVAVVASFQYLASETAQSGMSEYVSIIFSDGSTMLSYWREFLFALVEQAPIFGATLFLGAVLALLGSLKSAFRNAQIIFYPNQLIN